MTLRGYVRTCVGWGLFVAVAVSAPPIVHGQGAPGVNVNVSPLPLPITDADNAARHPFQIVRCTSGSFNGAAAPPCPPPPGSFAVPAGQRAVVEYVSVECLQLNLASLRIHLNTIVNGVSASYNIPLKPAFGQFSDGSQFLDGAQQTRIYADPGSTIGTSSSASSIGTLPGSERCTIIISGYMVAL